MAVLTVFFSVPARVGSLMLPTILLISPVSRSGLDANTKPTAANDTIRIGISERNEK
ncbi:hypothetical protein D3C78_1958320 [compost metagenome]